MLTRLLICALTTTILAVPARSALAQDERDPATLQQITKLKEEASKLFRRNNPKEALTKFQQVLELQYQPDDELLFNMAFIAWDLKLCREFVLYSTGFLYMAPGDKQAGELKSKRARCLKRAGSAKLAIESVRPKTVEVRVSNVVVGRTPVYELQFVPGDYQIIARDELYHNYNETETLDPNIESRHRINMRKRQYKGHIEVTTDPPEAVVYLDEVKVGPAPYKRKELPTRRYLVRIEKEGWDRWVRYISIDKGQTTQVPATLEKTGTTVPIPPLPKND